MRPIRAVQALQALAAVGLFAAGLLVAPPAFDISIIDRGASLCFTYPYWIKGRH